MDDSKTNPTGEQTGDLEAQLKRLGSTPQPAPNSAFANRLETDLRLLALGSQEQKRPVWRPLLGALAAGLLVLVGIASMMRLSPDSSNELVMNTANETRLVLPDGSELVAVDGVQLLDGTRIHVGSDGGAVIGHLVLMPGTVAIVVDGQVEILAPSKPSDTAGSPSTTGFTTTQRFESSTTATTNPPGPSTTGRADGGVVETDVGRTTDPTEPTSTTTPGETTTTTTTGPTSTSGQPSTTDVQVLPGDPDSPVLRVEPASDTRASLVWTVESNDQIAGWLVINEDDGVVNTVAVLRDPDARRVTVEVPMTGTINYWVVAKDSNGNALMESNVVTVGG